MIPILGILLIDDACGVGIHIRLIIVVGNSTEERYVNSCCLHRNMFHGFQESLFHLWLLKGVKPWENKPHVS